MSQAEACPTQTISISVNLKALQGKPLRKLQRLSDLIRFAQVGSDLVGEEHFPGKQFMSIAPAHGAELSLEEARTASREWVTLHGLRDGIEAVSLFLEEVRRVAELYRLAAGGKTTVGEWQALQKKNLSYHRLGLPKKIERLAAEFGIESDFGDQLLSLNRARNCVVHRDGQVTPLDADEDGVLHVTVHELQLLAVSPRGEERVISVSGEVVEAGWSIAVRSTPRKIAFSVGERVAFSFTDVRDAMFSMQSYVSTMVASVQDYAASLGIEFDEGPAMK